MTSLFKNLFSLCGSALILFYAKGMYLDWMGNSFDAYNFIVLFILSFYLVKFLFNLHKNQKDEPEKIPSMMNMEFLRIIFTLLIVYYHVCETLGRYNKGWLGVEFFFILSGFFLFITYTPEKDILSFIKNKFIRFSPLILFGGLLCALFYSSILPGPFLSEILFLANTGLDTTEVNVPAWYIAVLFWVSLFYFYLMKTQKKENTNIIIGIISFFSYIACVRYGFENRQVTIGMGDLLTIGLLRGTAGIGLGYFIGQIYQMTQNHFLPKVSSKVFSVAEIYFFCCSVYLCTRPFTYVGSNLFICLNFAVLVLLFAFKRGIISNWCERLVFTKISKYCLSIFLTHRVLTHHILPFLINKFSDPIQIHYGITISLVLIASCILGIITHYTIEKPATRFLKSMI